MIEELKKYLSRIRGKQARDRRRSFLMDELRQEKSILNPEEVAEQFLNHEPIISYQYNDHKLCINNERSALYHLTKSTAKIEKMVHSIDLSQCRISLDIGANTGLFTYFLKQKYPDVVAYLFEPDERLFPIIKKNLAGIDKWELLNIGVSDSSNDTVDFYINPDSAQTNSLIKEAVTLMGTESAIVSKKVKTITIDEFCSQRAIDTIDVLKIDIQGGEMKAFSKAPRALKNTKLLLSEVTFMGDDTYEVLSLLKSYFNHYKAINSVYMGADLMFYNR